MKQSRELKVAIKAAKKAGRLQLSRLNCKLDVQSKGSKDFVTDVDKESEKIILGLLGKSFPSYAVLAEESGEKGNGEFKWLVDPLDGTHTYMTGLPSFGVSIALEKSGEIILGVIFLPYFGELLFAEKGKGAFLNKKRIFVSKKAGLEESSGSLSFIPKTGTIAEYSRFYDGIFPKMLNMKYAGGTTDLARVASGRLDFFITRNTTAWDCAAAKLIIEEAGGKVTSFEGKPAPYISTMVASNGLLHEKILKELNGK